MVDNNKIQMSNSSVIVAYSQCDYWAACSTSYMCSCHEVTQILVSSES